MPLALAIITIIALVAISSFSIFFTFPSSSSTNMTSDQSTTIAEPLAPKLQNILLIANENVLRIAPNNDLYPEGLWHTAMTFNGTIPGPLITTNQGDTLNITLI